MAPAASGVAAVAMRLACAVWGQMRRGRRPSLTRAALPRTESGRGLHGAPRDGLKGFSLVSHYEDPHPPKSFLSRLLNELGK